MKQAMTVILSLPPLALQAIHFFSLQLLHCNLSDYQGYKADNAANINYTSLYPRTEYTEEEDGELSWFNAGVRVGVGISLGICLGVGVGVGLLVGSYKASSKNFRRLL